MNSRFTVQNDDAFDREDVGVQADYELSSEPSEEEEAEEAEAEAAAEAAAEEEELEAAAGQWWDSLPDYIKPGYDVDIPAFRLPLAQHALTMIGASDHCPEAACRRSQKCLGGSGPPCFRADREGLGHMLLLWHWHCFYGLTLEECRAAMDAKGSRYGRPYAPNKAEPVTAGRQARPRRGRPGRTGSKR